MNDTGAKILEALFSIFDGEEKKAQANLTNYLNNAAGIGEHPELDKAIDSQIMIIAEHEDKLSTVKRLLQEWAIELSK